MTEELKALEKLVNQARSEASGFVVRSVERFNAKIKAFQTRLKGNPFSLIRGWAPLNSSSNYYAFHPNWIDHELSPEVRKEIQTFVDEINEIVKFMELADIEATIVWRDMALRLEDVSIRAFNNFERRAQVAQEIAEKQGAFLKEEVRIEIQGAAGSA